MSSVMLKERAIPLSLMRVIFLADVLITETTLIHKNLLFYLHKFRKLTQLIRLVLLRIALNQADWPGFSLHLRNFLLFLIIRSDTLRINLKRVVQKMPIVNIQRFQRTFLMHVILKINLQLFLISRDIFFNGVYDFIALV